MQSWLTLHHLWECFKLLLYSDFCSIAKTTTLAYFQNWIPRIVENVQKFLICILFSGEQFSSIDTEFIFWVCLVTIHYRYFFPISKPRLQRRGRKCNLLVHEGLSWWWQECQIFLVFLTSVLLWFFFFSPYHPILLLFITANKTYHKQAKCHQDK